ncbi:MAG: zinc ribbon domain-containing protein [Candidatus Bathyarchaeota archaeon]|nr:zinc ribbon domain-containing protein [Candidatus Bathyarchaeota archaeon]
MSYCPKCGNPVEDQMAFCPRCGASLKGAEASAQATPPPYTAQKRNEKEEKNEKKEKEENREKQEKGERGFVGYLIGGLVLITFGLFSVLQLSGYFNNSAQTWAIMLLIIGVIIIVGAVYMAMIARRRHPVPR